MGKVIDLTGKKFGRLTVIERAENKVTPKGRSKTAWRCRCDCGNIVTVDGMSLKTGNTKSCGCLHFEIVSKRSLCDLKGQKFGRLTVLKRAENSKSGKVKWLCQCDCGNQISVMSSSLKSGSTKSCGCLHSETSCRNNYRHGLHGKRLYTVWKSMKSRCYCLNSKEYNNYGARGITVCEEWKNNFQSFYEWAMQSGYDENAKRGECTLDRIDPNGDYCPENCRWITIAEQQLNKRTNVFIEFNGEKKTIKEWSDSTGIPYSVLYKRIFTRKWNIEKALTQKIKIGKQL